MLRDAVQRIRSQEREIMDLCVSAGMPRKTLAYRLKKLGIL